MLWTSPRIARRSVLACLVLLCFPEGVKAQIPFLPQNAHVNLYFPQLADGGTAEQQWQTRFTFANPNNTAATVDVEFFKSDGSPLALDFGAGVSTTLAVSIPARGTRVLRSTIASPSVVVGWAQAFADLPLQATAAYRVLENGTPKLEVNAEPTLPSRQYTYPATPFLGVAVANVYDAALSVRVLLRNAEGGMVGQNTLQVGPLGHSTFTLHERFPGLPNTFEGTLEMSVTGLLPDFLAWGLASDSQGIISSLPPGRLGRPESHWDNIELVFYRTLHAARRVQPEVFSAPVKLRIGTDLEINAYASNGDTVQINLALSELIGDSPSELAHVVGHELGHIYQQRTGELEAFPGNAERDADLWGFAFALIAGYEPYGVAGSLAKAAMVTGSSDLVSQSQAFFDNLSIADAHGSFNERIATVFDTVVAGCSGEPSCDQYKSIFHPHFPQSAPLLRMDDPGRRRPLSRQAP